MKKTFTKVISVILCVAMLLGATSVCAFAADTPNSEVVGDLGDALSDWFDALMGYSWDDFYGFVTAVLHMFGFQGSFEGFQSIPALMDEWFGFFGDLGDIYENLINAIDTDQLVELINRILSLGSK